LSYRAVVSYLESIGFDIPQKCQLPAHEAFLTKAPAPTVEGLKARASELKTLIEKTQRNLDGLAA
jgi:hypothetical protein